MYFEKRKATAVGLVTAGAGLGTLTLLPLCRTLFDNLSYQEALIVMSAITMQFIVLVMLVRPESYWQGNSHQLR